MKRHTFARGEWGGEWHPDFAPDSSDIVVKEHWGSSGFANTDLDLQLKQHGISHVIVVGLLANTCAETTARYAQEIRLNFSTHGAYRFLAKHAVQSCDGIGMECTRTINSKGCRERSRN